jgi:hypothetical protein
MREMLLSDLHLMPPLDSFTAAWPWRTTLSPDACGVFSFKLLHFLLRNSSYLQTVHRNSEKRGTTMLVAHSGDHHDDLVKAAVDTGFAAAVDQINFAGFLEMTDGGRRVPSQILFSADKPAVEAMRGSGQCCAWCFCEKGMLHVIPFTLDTLPANYAAWLEGLSNIPVADGKTARCIYPVKTSQATVLAHSVAPGETLPTKCLAKKCPCFGKLPFADPAAMEARVTEKREAKKAAITLKQKQALGRERSSFAEKHSNQNELCLPVFLSADMDSVVVELLHMCYLNIPKSFVKWGALRHLDEEMRAALQAWFKSIGISIDFRHKDKGRDKQQKWCSGDQWAKVIKGCDKNPNGLAGLAAFIVDLLVEQHCIDLAADPDDSAKCAAAQKLRQAWAAFDPKGLSVDQIAAKLESLLGSAAEKVEICLRGFHALHDLMRAVNEPWVDETNKAEREERAYRAAIAGIKLAVQWEAAGPTHRSWYMHIMLYILPRQIAALGDLWRFSSGPLEARGASLQRSVRTNFTYRPTAAGYSGNLLVHAGTMVEASKHLTEPELDSRKKHRLDYFGRASRAQKIKASPACDAESADPMLEWSSVKQEVPSLKSIMSHSSE